jgi:hypothetical protein
VTDEQSQKDSPRHTVPDDLNEAVRVLGRARLFEGLLTMSPDFVAALCAGLLLFVAGGEWAAWGRYRQGDGSPQWRHSGLHMTQQTDGLLLVIRAGME